MTHRIDSSRGTTAIVEHPVCERIARPDATPLSVREPVATSVTVP